MSLSPTSTNSTTSTQPHTTTTTNSLTSSELARSHSHNNHKTTTRDGYSRTKPHFKTGSNSRQRKGGNSHNKNSPQSSPTNKESEPKPFNKSKGSRSSDLNQFTASNNSSKPLKPSLSHSPDGELYLRASGRKGKGNLTHMMNFTLPPRQTHSETFRRSKSFASHKKSTPFNKYRYMNANFRFLIRASQDYKLQLINPDDYVEWNDVQQVVVNTTEELSCPICLSPPVAPRMTACGHLYCHPCILRYLNEQPADTARNWRKCPICYDPIYSRALKPVMHLLATTQSKSPGIVSFRLMQRYPGSTVALPCFSDPRQSPETSLPWDDTPGALVFSRLILCSSKHISSHLKSEKEALLVALREAQSQGEPIVARFIQTALSELTSEIAGYAQAKDPTACNYLSDSLDLHSDPPSKFYQSEDGQYLYLHPLHARVITQYFESTEEGLPLQLDLPVTHYEESTIDEEMRGRFKSLAYLPLGCDVSFADIDLESFVSSDLITQYKGALDTRSRHLKAKKKAEMREEARANANHFSALQVAYPEESGYDVASDPNAFPDILPHAEPTEDGGDPLALYGLSPSPSGDNWASMATRTRNSASGWTSLSREDHAYAPRSHRTLGEDIDRAITESILSLSGMDLDSPEGSKKGGKKGGKKKLVLVSSNVQRRR